MGGFLGQKFAVHTAKSQRVQSLILCNSFMDTTVFSGMPHSSAYRFLPSFILKRYLLEAFPKGRLESEIANSVDFMVERVSWLVAICQDLCPKGRKPRTKHVAGRAVYSPACNTRPAMPKRRRLTSSRGRSSLQG